MSKRLRVAFRFVAGFVSGLMFVVLMQPVLMLAFGFQTLTVMSGSMEPAIGTGDLVVVRAAVPMDLRVGDVVTFQDPDDPDKLWTHRVRSAQGQGANVKVVTKGDANNTTETWYVSGDGSVGKVFLRVPKIGLFLAQLNTPLLRILLVAVPALLWALMELRRIWKQPTVAKTPQPTTVARSGSSA